MAGLLIEERRGIALMGALKVLPSKYRSTHVPCRVNTRGHDPINATVCFSPGYTFCCPVVTIKLKIRRHTSQEDKLYFVAEVLSYEVVITTCQGEAWES